MSTIISNEGCLASSGLWDAGFEVNVTGSYSFGVHFDCTAEVAEQICKHQEKTNAELEETSQWDKLTFLRARVDGLARPSIIHEGGCNDPEFRAVYVADHEGMFRGLNFGWVWYEVEAGCCREVFYAEGAGTIMHKYADKLEDIYENKTAGDHTFLGLLATMLQEMRDKGVQLDN